MINFFLFFKIADNLEEVNVPIMKSCKGIDDIYGNEICAGDENGGHDACQGSIRCGIKFDLYVPYILDSISIVYRR